MKTEIQQIKERHGVEPSISFECSPYIRCMETAVVVGKELGFKECTINWNLGEFLHARIFEKDPRPFIKSRTQEGVDEFNQKYATSHGVNFNVDQESQQEYMNKVECPEGLEEFKLRCRGFF